MITIFSDPKIIILTYIVFFLQFSSFGQSQLNYVGSSTIGNFIEDADLEYSSVQFTLDTEPESSGGEKAILEGQADLAGVANIPSPATLNKGVVSTIIGWDAIALVVHEDIGISNLTIVQLKQIFSGKITNWQELGGEDVLIQPFITGIESATHKVFRSVILGESDYRNCQEVNLDIDILEKVKNTKGAIGHISSSFLREVENANTISVNGQKLTLTNSNYPITRPLYLLWWSGRHEVAEFVDWVLSREGQRIVMKRFIGVRERSIEISDNPGTLIVYTDTYIVEDGGTFFYPHRAYEILSTDNQVIMQVSNHLNSNDESPTKVKLTQGNYFIRPENINGTQSNIFVTVESGKLTKLDVRNKEELTNTAPLDKGTNLNQPNQYSIQPYGDLRIRGEQDFRNSNQRFRGRFRMRLGLSTNISNSIKFEMRLTTTNNLDDPNSPYSDFTDGFNQVAIGLDRANVQWSPTSFKSFKLLLGKFANPFLNSSVYSELSWDADIQPEGIAIKFNFLNLGRISRLTFVNGTYELSQFQTNNINYWMNTNQIGLEMNVAKNHSLTFGSGFYYFQNIKGSQSLNFIFDENSGNSTFEKMQVSGIDTSYTTFYKTNFYVNDNFLLWNCKSTPQPLTLKIQYFHNFGTSTNNNGVAAGFSYGDLNSKGKWRIYYQYQRLEADAVFTPFVQDDFFKQSDFKSNVFGLAYAFDKKISLHGWSLWSQILDAPSEWESRWRLDLNLKI